MSIDLSDMADNLRLGRVVTESGRLSDTEINDLRQLLDAEPANLVARTRLLAHYNKLAYSGNMTNIELSNVRFEHIRWFVQQIPESRFCGEMHCYLAADDPNYLSLKQIWIEQSQRANLLMSSVNAFLFCANGKDSELYSMLERLSDHHKGNIWIAALQSLLDKTDTWSSVAIDEQIKTPSVVAKEISRITSLFNNIEANRLAASASASASKSEYFHSLDRLQNHPDDERARAVALGYTFSSYLSSSVLGFNPELTAERFKQMCWVIRHAPSSEFASHAFAMDPLDELDQLNETLAVLWSEEIRKEPSNKLIMQNAAIFCSKLGVSNVSKVILEQLNKTESGRKIFAQAASRF